MSIAQTLPRRVALAVASVAAMLSLSAPGAAATPPGATATPKVARAPHFEQRLLDVINAARARQGIRALRSSAGLRRAARTHSRSMGRHGFFSHTSANGTPFSRRIQRFYPSRGYSRWTVGENLVWGGIRMGPWSALRRWVRSSAHRQALFAGKWREVGIGAVRVSGARGYYRGRSVTIVTVDFGSRSR